MLNQDTLRRREWLVAAGISVAAAMTRPAWAAGAVLPACRGAPPDPSKNVVASAATQDKKSRGAAQRANSVMGGSLRRDRVQLYGLIVTLPAKARKRHSTYFTCDRYRWLCAGTQGDGDAGHGAMLHSLPAPSVGGWQAWYC